MKKILLSALLLPALQGLAQDANFSQIQNTPLLLNPAHTGNFDKSWRINGGYRNTTFSGMRSFNTGYLSADARIKGKGISENDRLGIGVYGFLDANAGGSLKSNYFGLSLAYNKALGAGTRLGVGAQAVYAAQRLDMSKLVFEDQFGSGGFSGTSVDAGRMSGSENYFDLNVGLMLSHDAGGRWGGEIGATAMHLTKPKASFLGTDYRVPVRYQANASAWIRLKGNDRIQLQGLFVTQDKAEYVQGGFIFSKALKLTATETSLDLGVLTRNTNVVIPYLGLGWGRTKGALTYDVTTNKSKMAGLNRQSLEIFLTHTF
ncbi:PorP/SprF family type IX secretion system membrane protein [Flaviaesturariibacter amylovorans]|uniref:Type IX secretion system membrane protein PorP/SprF n=1 Tax=Flaviaesturariibacter amylovorans TaxID=1084520 RepID=A0ABP8HJP7_9BACT